MLLSYHFKKRKGFSIIEVLIATTLVAGVLLGVFALLGPALKASSISNNMLVASFLAKEGAELVVNVRDTNWWNGYTEDSCPHNNNGCNRWDKNLDLSPGGSPSFKEQAGIISYDMAYDPTIVSPGGIDYAVNFGNFGDIDSFFSFNNAAGWDTRLYLDASNDFYTHNPAGNIPTPYRRMVIAEFDNSGGAEKIIVTSIVRWGDDPTDVSKEVRFTNYLYNWLP